MSTVLNNPKLTEPEIRELMGTLKVGDTISVTITNFLLEERNRIFTIRANNGYNAILTLWPENVEAFHLAWKPTRNNPDIYMPSLLPTAFSHLKNDLPTLRIEHPANHELFEDARSLYTELRRIFDQINLEATVPSSYDPYKMRTKLCAAATGKELLESAQEIINEYTKTLNHAYETSHKEALKLHKALQGVTSEPNTTKISYKPLSADTEAYSVTGDPSYGQMLSVGDYLAIEPEDTAESVIIIHVTHITRPTEQPEIDEWDVPTIYGTTINGGEHVVIAETEMETDGYTCGTRSIAIEGQDPKPYFRLTVLPAATAEDAQELYRAIRDHEQITDAIADYANALEYRINPKLAVPRLIELYTETKALSHMERTEGVGEIIAYSFNTEHPAPNTPARMVAAQIQEISDLIEGWPTIKYGGN
jgi:hypothetical protein